MLPEYKGMYTSAHPILNNEKRSGCTFHLIDDGIDTGDIIFQKSFKINPNDYCSDVYSKYLENGISLVYEKLDYLINDQYSSRKQSKLYSTYYSKKSIDYSELRLSLKTTAYQLGNQLRAFSFRQYQLPTINDKKIFGYKILDHRSKTKTGSIIGVYDYKYILSTIDYDIEVYFDNLKKLISSVKTNNASELKSELSRNSFTIDERDENGWTALIISIYNGFNECTKTLLDFGANPNITNWKGTTPLMYAKHLAEFSGDLSVLELLMNYGANTEKKDMHNKTVFDYLNVKNEYYSMIHSILRK